MACLVLSIGLNLHLVNATNTQVITIPYTDIPQSENYYAYAVTIDSDYEAEIVNTLTGSFGNSSNQFQVFAATSGGWSTFDIEYSTATTLYSVNDVYNSWSFTSNGTIDVSNVGQTETFTSGASHVTGSNQGGVPTYIGVANEAGTLTGGSLVITIISLGPAPSPTPTPTPTPTPSPTPVPTPTPSPPSGGGGGGGIPTPRTPTPTPKLTPTPASVTGHAQKPSVDGSSPFLWAGLLTILVAGASALGYVATHRGHKSHKRRR